MSVSGGTRTCIHTPSAPLNPEELQPYYEEILATAALVYFDGRLTEAAIPVAQAARNAGFLVRSVQPKFALPAWSEQPYHRPHRLLRKKSGQVLATALQPESGDPGDQCPSLYFASPQTHCCTDSMRQLLTLTLILPRAVFLAQAFLFW